MFGFHVSEPEQTTPSTTPYYNEKDGVVQWFLISLIYNYIIINNFSYINIDINHVHITR